MSDSQAADVRVAIAEVAPRLLDLDANVETACALVREAAAEGALIVAFGEAWLTGYPIHVWAAPQSDLWWRFAAQYLDRALEFPSNAIETLETTARECGIDIVIGASEREPVTQGTLYSSIALVGAEGRLLGKHRKLRPAPHERSVWADGEASGLKAYARDYGFLSAMTGLEHQMVLPAAALAEEGTQFHVASWPGGDAATEKGRQAPWRHQQLLSRAFAVQVGSFVLCAAGRLDRDGVPEAYRDLFSPLCSGGNAVYDPFGEPVARVGGGERLFIADCPVGLISAAKVGFDGGGHSARMDQLELRNHARTDGFGDENEAGLAGGALDDASMDVPQDGEGWGEWDQEQSPSGAQHDSRPAEESSAEPARRFSRRDLFRRN